MGTNYSRSATYSKILTFKRVPTIQEVSHIQEIPTMQRVPTIQRWSLAMAKLCKLFTWKGTLKRTNLHIFISTNQVELMSDLLKSNILHWLSNKFPKWSYNWDLIWSVGLFLDETFLIVSKHELLVVWNMCNSKAPRVTRKKVLKPPYPFKPLVSNFLLEITSQAWSFNDYLRPISFLVA